MFCFVGKLAPKTYLRGWEMWIHIVVTIANNPLSLIYLSSNSAKRLSKCRSASFMRSVYKLRSLRAWSLVMLRTSSRLRVRSLARGLIAILSISLFMMMEPAAKHYTGTCTGYIFSWEKGGYSYSGTRDNQETAQLLKWNRLTLMCVFMP